MPKENNIESDKRPWGEWFLYKANCRVAAIKLLVLNPGERLSVQRHRHRSEEWYLLAGKARVYRGENPDKLKEITLEQRNESVVIPAKMWHSLENIGKGEVLIKEIATGFYDEEDIERSKDRYGRV